MAAYKPIANDVLEIRVYVFDPLVPTQLAVNVTHWQISSVTTGGATQGEIATRVDGLIAVPYKAWLNNGVSYKGVTVQKVFPLPRLVGDKSIAGAGVGTGGANQLPTQVSGLVTQRAALAGRPFRGRLYIPFPSTAWADANGNLNNAGLTVLTTLAGAFGNAITTTGAGGNTIMVPGIWHRKGYGKPPANIGAFDATNGYAPSPLFATQRKRGNYGRSNPTSPI